MAAATQFATAADGNASRWAAVAVALDADEAMISLEQEMQKAYAAFVAEEAAPANETAEIAFSQNLPAAAEPPQSRRRKRFPVQNSFPRLNLSPSQVQIHRAPSPRLCRQPKLKQPFPPSMASLKLPSQPLSFRSRNLHRMSSPTLQPSRPEPRRLNSRNRIPRPPLIL